MILSVPIATFSQSAVGVLVSPGNLETEQVTMYRCPISRVDGLDEELLALIGCSGTMGYFE